MLVRLLRPPPVDHIAIHRHRPPAPQRQPVVHTRDRPLPPPLVVDAPALQHRLHGVAAAGEPDGGRQAPSTPASAGLRTGIPPPPFRSMPAPRGRAAGAPPPPPAP